MVNIVGLYKQCIAVCGCYASAFSPMIDIISVVMKTAQRSGRLIEEDNAHQRCSHSSYAGSYGVCRAFGQRFCVLCQQCHTEQ